MIDDRVRTHLLEKLTRYEGNLYTLIRDIRGLVPHVTRDAAKVAAAKVEMAAAAIERLVTADASELELDELHAATDQLIMLRADLDRRVRGVERQEEDLELEAQRQKVRQMREELDREVSRASGHGMDRED